MSRAGTLRTLDMWGLRKGAFYDRHALEIPDGGAFDSLNVISVNGVLRPRPGLGPSPVDPDGLPNIPIRVLDEYVRFDGTRSLVVVNGPNTDGPGLFGGIYYNDDDGTGWHDIFTENTIANAGPLVAERVNGSSVTFKGVWYFNNWANEDAVVYWDRPGAVVDYLSSPSTQPNAQLRGAFASKHLAAHPDRLIVANIKYTADGEEKAYRVAWSAKLNAKVWRNEQSSDVGSGTSGYVDLADRSDPITALYASGDIVLAFRARSVYQGDFVGAPLMYKFRRLAEGAGCIAASTLCEYRDGTLLWLGDDNVYIGTANEVPRPVGEAIQPLIRRLCNVELLDRAVGVVDQDYHVYHLFLPNNTNGKVDVVLMLNLKDFSWWPGSLAASGMDVRAAVNYRRGTWDSKVLLGGNDGQVYDFSFDVVGDKGVVFPAYWQSGILSVDRYFQGIEQASIQQLRAYSGSGSVNLKLIQGDGLDRLSTFDFGNQVFDGTSSLDVSRRPKKAEHGMIKATWVDGTTKISGLSVGVIGEGATRGRR